MQSSHSLIDVHPVPAKRQPCLHELGQQFLVHRRAAVAWIVRVVRLQGPPGLGERHRRDVAAEAQTRGAGCLDDQQLLVVAVENLHGMTPWRRAVQPVPPCRGPRFDGVRVPISVAVHVHLRAGHGSPTTR